MPCPSYEWVVEVPLLKKDLSMWIIHAMLREKSHEQPIANLRPLKPSAASWINGSKIS